MKALWTTSKIFIPTLLAFLSVIYPDNKLALLIGASITATYSIISFVGGQTFESHILKEIKLLFRISGNLKNSLHTHKKQPHTVATAVIDISKNPPFQIESCNVHDVVDYGIGNFKILVNVPFSEHLIPIIESDCQLKPSVSVESCNGFTGVKIKWDGTEPKKIYFSLVSGEGEKHV